MRTGIRFSTNQYNPYEFFRSFASSISRFKSVKEQPEQSDSQPSQPDFLPDTDMNIRYPAMITATAITR